MDDLITRRAQPKDVARIVAMGREFLLNGPYKPYLEDRPEAATKIAAELVANKAAVILVLVDKEDEPHGVLAFILFPHYFSGLQTAGELIWYVEPEHRAGGWAMKMMWEAERIAKEAGAVAMQFTAPHDTEVHRIYERFGYKQVETCFQRRL